MKRLLSFTFLICFLSISASAAEIVEDFSSRLRFESGTAIWNQALGKIHPPLQAVNYKPGATPLPFSVGDGSHGAFDPSTYAQFSVNGDVSGNKIRFDLSRFPVLKVTSFHLAPGWVLEPVGNAPLIISSLSTVRIEGEIWCQGHDGDSPSGATPGVGGAGRCGGAAGGAGGAPGQNGQDGGSNTSSSATGGQGGHYHSDPTAVGGGGGGSMNNTPATQANDGPQSSSGANGGSKGQSQSDPEFQTLYGGAGGGGGGGTDSTAGAGGGGGGGTVIIHAVGDVEIGTSPTSTTGFIYAYGGRGGNTTSTAAGPGGGGGGGSIQIFSGGTINLFTADALAIPPLVASQAQGGAGGGNPGPAGATGADGRSWFASVDYNTTGTGSYYPSEELPVLANNNTVEFAAGPQTVTTNTMDLESTMARLDSFVLSPSSSDFTWKIKGSTDNFIFDDSGWTTDFSQVDHKRYLKIQFIINTSNVSNPTMLDSAQLTFTPGQRKDFEFKTSGCGSLSGSGSDSQARFSLFLLLSPLLLLLGIRYRTKKAFAK